MTTRETIRAILERLVAHLWLTAGAIFLVRALLPNPVASPEVPRALPAWCQKQPTVNAAACLWTDRAATLLAPDPRHVAEAHYLVRPFGASPCTLRPLSSNTPEATLLERCGQTRASPHESKSCDLPGDSGQLVALPVEQLDGCATVVGGPYDHTGNVLGGPVVPPILTLFPGLSISTSLLDFIDLRKDLDNDFLPLDRLEGRAFSGWLVLPLHQLDILAVDMPRALHLLTRAARAIGPRPFPDPVLLDLAGLSTCPSPGALPTVITEFEGIGLAPVGYRRPLPEPQPLAFETLARGGQPVLRVLSLRVSLATTPCPTLNSISPVGLFAQVASLIEAEARPDLPTALLLHFPDDSVSDATRETLLAQLDSLPGPLVVALFRRTSAGPLQAGRNGPRVMDMGNLIHEDSLLPSVTPPSGWVVQCYAPLAGSLTCVPRLVAGYFGDTLPLAAGPCNACQFLPAALDFLR